MHRGLAIAHFTSVCETKWVEFGFPIMKHTIIYHHVNLKTINGPELELCIYKKKNIYIGARLHYHPPQFHAHKKHTVNTIQNCFFRMLSCEHAYCFFVLIHFGDTVMSMWLYLYRMYASSKEPLRFPQRRAMFDKVQTMKLHFVLGFTAYFALWQVHASHGIKHCLAACPYKASNPW